ncbi:MAG: CPBP family intramembrane metalloprotease, partial [Planctomycetes bacterium]|nr:CPBP family intramembrane metalloprotease [Planctomycetota bacterium]
VAVTFASSSIYALVALRWTWSIFQREDVLLRGGADFDWRQWLRTWGTVRPGIGSALVAVIAMMALQLSIGPTLKDMATHRIMLTHQLLLIAMPAAVIAMLLSLNFRRTFRLRAANPVHLALAPVIAVSGLILVSCLNWWLLRFSFFRATGIEHGKILIDTMNSLGSFPSILAFMAVLPAVCEEFLFRGIVLSGFRRDLGRWVGIAGTGLVFGIAHQAPIAIVTVGLFGILLSWMALRSGALLVTIITHALWNGCLITAAMGKLPAWLFPPDDGLPKPSVIALAALALPVALWFFWRAAGTDEDEAAVERGMPSDF